MCFCGVCVLLSTLLGFVSSKSLPLVFLLNSHVVCAARPDSLGTKIVARFCARARVDSPPHTKVTCFVREREEREEGVKSAHHPRWPPPPLAAKL